MPVRITFTSRMITKHVWITAPILTSCVEIICAFLACGAVMGMMIVEMALMSPPPALQDTAHQVMVRLIHNPGGGLDYYETPPSLRGTV